MGSPDTDNRFARQTILPGVGPEGQKKWEESVVVLAGEGTAREAAQTALERSGLSQIVLLDPYSSQPLPSFSVVLITTVDPEWRRRLNRRFRLSPVKALYAWPWGQGFGLYLKSPGKPSCPCLECFEVANPKAFSKPSSSGEGGLDPTGSRLMGAMAATEVLQWILKEDSPLEGKVWMTSPGEGVSFQHEVEASSKCPAALAAERVLSQP